MSAEAPTREAIDAAHARQEAEGAVTERGVEHQKDGGAIVPEPPEEIRVEGTTELRLFDVGGKRATFSSLRLSGGKVLLVDGAAYSKGDVISFSGTAVVREVGQRDKPDPKTGMVVDAEQKHVAQITDLRVDAA